MCEVHVALSSTIGPEMSAFTCLSATLFSSFKCFPVIQSTIALLSLYARTKTVKCIHSDERPLIVSLSLCAHSSPFYSADCVSCAREFAMQRTCQSTISLTRSYPFYTLLFFVVFIVRPLYAPLSTPLTNTLRLCV